jgi:hypothetical protein
MAYAPVDWLYTAGQRPSWLRIKIDAGLNSWLWIHNSCRILLIVLNLVYKMILYSVVTCIKASKDNNLGEINMFNISFLDMIYISLDVVVYDIYLTGCSCIWCIPHWDTERPSVSMTVPTC